MKTTSQWYAIYTKPHHEKEVLNRLQELALHGYLQLLTTLRQWSDRKKKVCIHLFSCYVFVTIKVQGYYQVLNISGVVRYISFEGKAVAIPEKQIRIVKNLLEHEIETEEVLGVLLLVANVEIVAGPLNRVSGELIDFAGKKRVILQFDKIRKSMVISIPMHLLRLVG